MNKYTLAKTALRAVTASQEGLAEIHSVGSRTREWMIGAEGCAPLAERRIFLTGTTEARAGFRFQRVLPAFSQVLACTAGEGLVWLPGGYQPCRQGQVYITPSFSLHRYHALPNRPWKLAWVMYVESENQAPIIQSDGPRLFGADALPLATAISGLYREATASAELGFVQQWAELVDSCARRLLKPFAAQTRLFALWQKVDGDLAHPWTLPELADLAGLSAERLRLIAHHERGRSPMQHVAFLRMRRASILLRTSAESVQSIAWSVGYENAFAFSTTFKRLMGLSPLHYRQRFAAQR